MPEMVTLIRCTNPTLGNHVTRVLRMVYFSTIKPYPPFLPQHSMSSTLLKNFRPENIPAALSAFRSDDVLATLNEQFFEGGQCLVFKVDFPHGPSWAIRIPIHARDSSQDAILCCLRMEHEVLQEVRKAGFSWAPKCHGSSFTFENLVGFPFLALEWIEGRPLCWTPTEPLRPLRDKVLAQVAEIQMSLIECTKAESGYIKILPSRHDVNAC